MPIRRVFLGWDRPALPAAVDHLIKHFRHASVLDLQPLVVALPGARAGRRLLEILVAEAHTQGLLLVPPRIVTVGTLPDLLYEARRPFADDLVQQLAWVAALEACDPARVGSLVAALPAPDDLPAWLALGDLLGRLHRELAADGLDFQAVAACGSRIAGFREARRWELLRTIQQRYLRLLDELDLWDRQTARLVAIRQAECRADGEIVLLGGVDLNQSLRLMLDQVAPRVTALVVAPETLADRFDEHGCLRAAAWQEAPIDLRFEQFDLAEGAAEQALAAVRAVAALDGRYAADQITIGVPDERIVPYLQQHFQQAGVRTRYGVGTPVLESAPCRLLAAAAEYLETPSFRASAALVRHRAVQTWLDAQGIAGDWLTALDEYYAAHLPHALDDLAQAPDARTALVQKIFVRLDKLLAGLRGPARPVADWGQPVLDLLTALFGLRDLDPNVPAERAVLAACRQVREMALRLSAIPERLVPQMSGSQTLRLVLRELGSGTIATPADREAVELLGWLELPLDDAPALVVTGFNEGFVPSSLNADLFLPNQLRRELGIEDNDRRYARDAYALSVLAARPQLRLIAGRRDAEGNPLAPSRLLFACEPGEAARRALRVFSAERSAARPVEVPGALRAGRERSGFEPPRPAPLAEPVASMRVTEFRDYLACPYRYYLRHRLHLGALDDQAEELDGAAFGSLAHAVLDAFGRSPAAASADAEEIGQLLDTALRGAVAETYGQSPAAAVRVQVEQLRLRLEAFARWQAARSAEGWRIERVEITPQGPPPALLVDGRPMQLRGRIDRIDFHPASGRWAVLDYKTGDTPRTPDEVHRNSQRWVDLQLPLYRHLAAAMGIAGPIELGYIVLPKDTSRVACLPAPWSAEELQAADAAAAEVIRKVRREEFWPPTTPAPEFCEEFAAICQDGQFGGGLAALADEGGAER